MYRAVTAVLLGLLVVAPVGCVAARNVVTDRDLVCREAPDDVCIRAADLGLTRLDLVQEELRVGRIPTIQVYRVPCTEQELGFPVRDAARCWMVEATNQRGGVGVNVIERVDGRLEIP